MSIVTVKNIRILPLNKDDFPSYEDARKFIENGFHKDGEFYPGCINISMDNFCSNTLVLFQYKGNIIGSGILKIKSTDELYHKYYFLFDMDTVNVFEEPITSSELKHVVKEFKRFNSAPQIIDKKYAEPINRLISEKNSKTNLILDEYTSIVYDKTEGGKAKYYTTRIERDKRYRNEAIRIHGSKCQICGFDFNEVYGTLGEGFIEVHHRVPLYSLEQEIIPNPKTDLICVCSNCHRMLHRHKHSIIEPEELREIVKRKKTEEL